MIIRAQKLMTGEVSEYDIPTIEKAEAHSRRTDGVQWSPVDRKNFTGGVAMLWPRVTK